MLQEDGDMHLIRIWLAPLAFIFLLGSPVWANSGQDSSQDCILPLLSPEEESEILRDLTNGYLERMVENLEILSLTQIESVDGLEKAFQIAAKLLAPAEAVELPRFLDYDGAAIHNLLRHGNNVDKALVRFAIGWKRLTNAWHGRQGGFSTFTMMSLETDLNMLDDWITSRTTATKLEFSTGALEGLTSFGVTSPEEFAKNFTGAILSDHQGAWTLVRVPPRALGERDHMVRLILDRDALPSRAVAVSAAVAGEGYEPVFFRLAAKHLGIETLRGRLNVVNSRRETVGVEIEFSDWILAKLRIKHGITAPDLLSWLEGLEFIDRQLFEGRRPTLRFRERGHRGDVVYFLVLGAQPTAEGRQEVVTLFDTHDTTPRNRSAYGQMRSENRN